MECPLILLSSISLLVMSFILHSEGTNCLCPHPPFQGYTTSCSGSVFPGNKIAYSCSAGYALMGNKNRTCQENGTWTGSDPTCAEGCPCPTIYNGNTSPCNYYQSYSSRLNYTCNSEFQHVGSTSGTCQSDGSWSPSPPTCVRRCPCPTIPNGHTSPCNPQRYYSYLSFFCKRGYHRVGSNRGYCQSDGSWSPSPPICERDTPCPCPPLPANGTTSSCNGTASVGSSINYFCNLGYYREGSNNRMCLPDGNWTDAPTCERAKPCPCPSTPTNGMIDCNEGHVAGTGTRVMYSCNSGYALLGSSYRTCQENGNWTGTAPTCVTGCLCPTLLNGYTEDCPEAETDAVGSTIYYHCNNGYSLIGSSFDICQTNGNWSTSKPSCQKDTCLCPPSPSNGNISSCSGNTSVDTSVTYSCNSGYRIVGDSSRTCQYGGNWTGSAPVCLKYTCSCPPHPTNGYIRHCPGKSRSVGNSIHYYCNSGYSLVGDYSRRTCQYGGNWTGSASICVKNSQCPCPPKPANGRMSTCSGNRSYGSYVSFSCNPGFHQSSGDTRRRCSPGGIWSGSDLVCEKVKSCPCPPAPNNGSMNCSGIHEVPVNSRLYFKCDSGYRIVGDKYRTCHASGNWSKSTPICVKDVPCKCPLPQTHQHISRCSGNVSTGFKITHYCTSSGYRLAGDKIRTCQGNGTWTGSAPSCVNGCPCPRAPANGYTSSCSVYMTYSWYYSRSIDYYCNSGYTRYGGSSSRRCQSDGSWSGTAPVCVKSTPCQCPPAPANGRISSCSGTASVGHNLNYYCNTGYYQDGSSYSTCLIFGNWTKAPTCKEIKPCPCISLANGFTNCNGSHFAGTDTTVTYSCNSGYTLSGSSSRTCQNSGNWTGTVPHCLKQTCSCPSPSNGYTRSCSGTVYNGNGIYYYCNSGYSRSGSSYRRCQLGGSWSGSALWCLRNRCPCPPTPKNGYTTSCSSMDSVGSYVYYHCNSGYFLTSGDSSRRCLLGGNWTGSEPVCETDGCPCPPTPKNGYITSCYGVDAVGSFVYYYCNSGYLLTSGDSPRRCLLGGNWTGSEPVCEKDECSCPPIPTNGLISGCNFTDIVGDTIEYSCRSGYYLVGANTRTCQTGGNWTGSAPTCVAEQLCSCPPAPINGSRNCSGSNEVAAYGRLYYKCNSGYHIVGDEYRTCHPSGNWTRSTPVCEKDVRCQCPLPPSFGHISICYGSASTGYKVSYYCNGRYSLAGAKTRTCQENGSWTETNPICVEGCPCPKIHNGYTTNCTVYQGYGNSVSFHCHKGFEHIGSSNGTCHSDGSWSPSPPTCVRSTPCLCPRQPSNGYTSFCSKTATVGSHVNYYCNRGYYLIGSSSATCLPYGTWTATPVCERIKPCSCPLSPANGTTSCNGSFLAGTSNRVTYSCNSGYTLAGSNYRTCRANGLWTGTDPTCVKGCICPSAPVNGYIDDCSGTKPVDSILSYHCNTGYSIFSTNTSRICQSDGEWSGTAPKCEKDNCPCPLSPENGSIASCVGSALVGTYIHYYCDSGYKRVGDFSRMCKIGAIWTGNTPTCVKTCPCPSSLINGSINCNVSHLPGTGSRVTYSCNSGYLLSGSSYRTCQANGIWTGTDPTCVKGCICPSTPVNGYIVNCSGTMPVDSILSYHCNTGYSIISANTSRVCFSSGEWSGTAPKCEKDVCTCPLSPVNGYIASRVGSAQVGTYIHYYCDSGYERIGDFSTKCEVGAIWTGSTPKCEKIEGCPCPSSPTNGSTNCNGSHLAAAGSRVTYSCNSGYTLSGISYRTCQESGNWSLTAPTCVKESMPSEVPRGSVNAGLDIIFVIISSFIIVIFALLLMLLFLRWFMKRRSRKLQNRSEPINFASLEKADENAYQKVDAYNVTLKNDISLSENEISEMLLSAVKCSSVKKVACKRH